MVAKKKKVKVAPKKQAKKSSRCGKKLGETKPMSEPAPKIEF
jgi:hypothetical protein